MEDYEKTAIEQMERMKEVHLESQEELEAKIRAKFYQD